MKPLAGAEPERPLLRLVAAPGPPLGAVFGGIGLAAAAAAALLRLDRLPLTLCFFKGLTGLPCPTCGSTRAVSRLFSLDLAGALAMNPFTTVLAVAVGAWALADLVLMPRRQALGIEVREPLGFGLRVAVVLAFVANWVYLIATGR